MIYHCIYDFYLHNLFIYLFIYFVLLLLLLLLLSNHYSIQLQRTLNYLFISFHNLFWPDCAGTYPYLQTKTYAIRRLLAVSSAQVRCRPPHCADPVTSPATFNYLFCATRPRLKTAMASPGPVQITTISPLNILFTSNSITLPTLHYIHTLKFSKSKF